MSCGWERENTTVPQTECSGFPRSLPVGIRTDHSVCDGHFIQMETRRVTRRCFLVRRRRICSIHDALSNDNRLLLLSWYIKTKHRCGFEEKPAGIRVSVKVNKSL